MKNCKVKQYKTFTLSLSHMNSPTRIPAKTNNRYTLTSVIIMKMQSNATQTALNNIYKIAEEQSTMAYSSFMFLINKSFHCQDYSSELYK